MTSHDFVIETMSHLVAFTKSGAKLVHFSDIHKKISKKNAFCDQRRIFSIQNGVIFLRQLASIFNRQLLSILCIFVFG